jgi:CxxC-x17-CxxC domain-containing protein
MSFQDRTLHCSACGAAFIFSAEKQGFFQAWGLDTEPERCPSCCQAGKSARHRAGRGSGNRHQMFKATCAECGASAEVPFEPRPGRRVYCSDCYRKVSLHR